MEDKLISLLSRIGIEGARWIEEKADEQYRALTHLYQNLKDGELFVRLVVLNSLVSFQLNDKGENWWWEFAKYFSENIPETLPEDYIIFLEYSRTNRRLREVKIKRLKKAGRFVNDMDLVYYYNDMDSLRRNLASVLNTDSSSKTMVFTVKMFGYAMRIYTETFVPYPFSIPIPEDVRILNFTKKFTAEKPKTFWNRIAQLSNIPPLHIDSIFWPFLGGKNIDVMNKKFGKDVIITLKELIIQ